MSNKNQIVEDAIYFQKLKNTYISKKITADIKGYIKSVVDLEERIMWAKTPEITIPDMKYIDNTKKGSVGMWNFIKGCLP